MKTQDIVNTVIKLSQRSELSDELPTVVYYLNKVKLKLLRERRFRFNQATTNLTLKANKRTVDIPSDFLHTPFIRRDTANVTVNDPIFGTIIKQQFLKKYIDKVAFETDYPVYDANGNQLVGTVNAFVLWGASIYFGLIPIDDEILKFDYYCNLPDFDINSPSENALSIFGFDYCVSAAIEEVYTSWIISDKLKTLWANEKKDALISLKKLQVFEEANMGYDMDIEEPG